MQDSVSKMKYRLGIDLGTTSLGWAMLRLGEQNEPYAVIRTGVRILITVETRKRKPLWP